MNKMAEFRPIGGQGEGWAAMGEILSTLRYLNVAGEALRRAGEEGIYQGGSVEGK